MKKVGIILHTLGLLGCVAGAIGLNNYSWVIWQWPIIAGIWVLSSFISMFTVSRLEADIKLMDMLYEATREQLVKTQTALHKEQLKK